MNSQQFVESCLDIFGPSYVTRAADALDISVRSVQHYAKGSRPVPYWMPARLQTVATPLLERMQARMAMLEGFRRAAGVDATLAHPRAVRAAPDARAKQAAREAALRIVEPAPRVREALVGSVAPAGLYDGADDDGGYEEREDDGLAEHIEAALDSEDDTDWSDEGDNGDEGDV